jgi:hypothetical protein
MKVFVKQPRLHRGLVIIVLTRLRMGQLDFNRAWPHQIYRVIPTPPPNFIKSHQALYNSNTPPLKVVQVQQLIKGEGL